MRAVVQRASGAQVTVDGTVVGSLDWGILVYLGVAVGDQRADAEYLAEKVAGLRIFMDGDEKMNLSVRDVHGGALVISQFTLLADARKGRRPSYSGAAEGTVADELYRYFVECLRKLGVPTETGTFRASMQVSYTNEGPITILLDSKKLF